jgi:hypothetical protein
MEGGGGGLTVSGVSRNRGIFVKCVAIQKRLGIPALENTDTPTRTLLHTHTLKTITCFNLICSRVWLLTAETGFSTK